MNRTLFDISSDLLALHDLLSEVGGDVTDEQAEQAISEWFAEIGENRNKKLDAYVFLLAEFEARAELRRKEAQRIAARAQVDESACARLKTRLKEFFKLTGLKSVETDLYRITLASNGGKVPLIVLPDLDPLEAPKEFQKVVTMIDNEAVRAALESGQTLEFASLGERGDHIRIK